MVRRRFSAQISTAQKGLRRVMERMGVDSYEVTERNGSEIVVMFVLKSKDEIPREYRYICDTFEHPADNYRAAQMALDYMWRIHEDYCVRAEGGEPLMETILKGFRVLRSQEVLLALPDPEKRQAWDILGVSRDATIEEINEAYRLKAKEMHPDVGGNTKSFKQLQKACEEMREITK